MSATFAVGDIIDRQAAQQLPLGSRVRRVGVNPDTGTHYPAFFFFSQGIWSEESPGRYCGALAAAGWRILRVGIEDPMQHPFQSWLITHAFKLDGSLLRTRECQIEAYATYDDAFDAVELITLEDRREMAPFGSHCAVEVRYKGRVCEARIDGWRWSTEADQPVATCGDCGTVGTFEASCCEGIRLPL